MPDIKSAIDVQDSLATNDRWGQFRRVDIDPRPANSAYKGIPAKTTDSFAANLGPNIGESDASHFLGQATFGADRTELTRTASIGITAWITEQIAMAAPSYQSRLDTIWEHFRQQFIDQFGLAVLQNDPDVIPFKYGFYWNMAWWEIMMTEPAQLRQRVAFALSQIMVISDKSDLSITGDAMANYYDVLSRHAFGNFRNLLRDVAMHPAMGFYLSHLFNSKGDPAINLRPDENFAREVMQLFSIGLFELNPDGSRKQDDAGNDIPTYSNDDIANVARVFTGFEIGSYTDPWDPSLADRPVRWNRFINDIPQLLDMTQPMRMNDEFHDQDIKTIMGTHTLPAGQTGMQDFEAMIDILFNHSNTGPFIGRQLIQRLVKSNPSPEYIARITAVFDDDGTGTRGNLGAVITAILTDEEARLRDGTTKKVREPIVRYTHMMRAFGANNTSGRLWNIAFAFDELVGQLPLSAPSVFNFFQPSFAPNGPIFDNDLDAPEFQLHDSNRAVGMANFGNNIFQFDYMMDVYSAIGDRNGLPDFDGGTKPDNVVSLDLTFQENLASNPDSLVGHLDILMTGGQLSADTKADIVEALDNFGGDDLRKTKMAIFLIYVSPEYVMEA